MLKYSRGKQDQLDHESKVEEEAYEAPEAKEEEDEVPVQVGDLAVRVGLCARIRIDNVIKISFLYHGANNTAHIAQIYQHQ